ncbi:hypothetical protein SLEP1_g28795 [Rubroshorea leprosula]|uniref:Uncharacterized protein n=1 Tax=Rubroshorea leprosula TaxID=152421 RepID=A0AAV5K189_9ROSI|nr:hypothetical protein SLEP1_g28795 [Rubroshorea leprosula]
MEWCKKGKFKKEMGKETRERTQLKESKLPPQNSRRPLFAITGNHAPTPPFLHAYTPRPCFLHQPCSASAPLLCTRSPALCTSHHRQSCPCCCTPTPPCCYTPTPLHARALHSATPALDPALLLLPKSRILCLLRAPCLLQPPACCCQSCVPTCLDLHSSPCLFPEPITCAQSCNPWLQRNRATRSGTCSGCPILLGSKMKLGP